MPKLRSTGAIYSRPGTKNLQLYCCFRGKAYRKSAGTSDKAKAKRMLADWLEELGYARKTGKPFTTPRMEKRTVADLLNNLTTNFEVRHIFNKSVRAHLKPIREFFQHYRALEVDAPMIQRYVAGRQQVVADSTINRECQLLLQSFRLAEMVPPRCVKLAEHNVRTGEFSAGEFERVLSFLPDYLKPFASWGWWCGWRSGSIKSLRWADITGDVLLCRSQYSKDRKLHRIPLVGPLKQIVDQCRMNQNGPFVFHQDDGRPVGNYDSRWNAALKLAGLEGRHFHDLRRCAGSNLRRAGVDVPTIMLITGHSTLSMFSRYQIVNDQDVRKALETRQQFETTLQAESEPPAVMMVQ